MLTCQIWFEFIYCVVSLQDKKNCYFGQILKLGDSFTQTPLLMRAKFGIDVVDVWYAYVPNFISISLFCHPLVAKNSRFCNFWFLQANYLDFWRDIGMATIFRVNLANQRLFGMLAFRNRLQYCNSDFKILNGNILICTVQLFTSKWSH